MSIRILSGDRTFVQDIELPVIRDAYNRSFIPISKDQVEIQSIQISNTSEEDVSFIVESMSKIFRNDRSYEGTLVERGDGVATLDSGLYKISIKGWDRIDEPRYVEVLDVDSDRVLASFITSGITGTIIHRLFLGNRSGLDTSLYVENRTDILLEDVEVEIMTAEETRAAKDGFLMQASVTQSESGTLYTLGDTYDIPPNTRVLLPMLSSTMNRIDTYYIIDLSNGGTSVNNQAVQVISLTPSVDLPSGTLYVYRNNKLDASTYLPATGKSQTRELSILRIPSIFSVGSVLIDTMKKQDKETGIDMDTITLEGTLKNGLPIRNMVYIRYYVGTSIVVQRGISNGRSYKRQGSYLMFPHSMMPDSSQDYSYTFTIKR